MPWGGRRPGAGRKSNAETKRLRAVINEAISREKWVQIMAKAGDIALEGNYRILELLLRYYYGAPQPEEAEPFPIIPIGNFFPPRDDGGFEYLPEHLRPPHAKP